MLRVSHAVLLIWGTCIILAGCAGSHLIAVHPFEQKLNPYRAVYFSTESMTVEDINKEIFTLEEQVVTRLKNMAIFEQALLGECENQCEKALNVKAVITGIKKVSGSARFWGGAFAGKASLTADVIFADGVTGDTLGVYTVTGKSGGTGVSGGTESAVKKTAQAITELIYTNYQ